MKTTKATITYKGKKYPAIIFSRKDHYVIQLSPEVFMPKFVEVSFAEKSKN